MSDAEHEKTQVLGRPPATAAPGRPLGLLRCVDSTVLNSASGREIRLETSALTIGRGAENGVVLDAHGISRNHARLFFDDGTWQVEDLGSTNGTRVNDDRVERRPLADGDTVAFGRVCYRFHLIEHDDPAEVPTETPASALMQQTLVITPEQRLTPEPPSPAPKVPGAEQIYDSGTHRRPDPAPEPKRNVTAIVVVAIILLGVAGAAAAWYLKLF